MDVSIVLNTPIGQKREATIPAPFWQSILKHIPKSVKLDIDPGSPEVLQTQENSIGSFGSAIIVAVVFGGNDLGPLIFNVTNLGGNTQALNGDLSTFLDQMSPAFKTMTDADVAKVIYKKLVRVAYYFVAEKDGSWYTNLSQCTAVAAAHIQTKVARMAWISTSIRSGN